MDDGIGVEPCEGASNRIRFVVYIVENGGEKGSCIIPRRPRGLALNGIWALWLSGFQRGVHIAVAMKGRTSDLARTWINSW